jgi:hypothetical protein
MVPLKRTGLEVRCELCCFGFGREVGKRSDGDGGSLVVKDVRRRIVLLLLHPRRHVVIVILTLFFITRHILVVLVNDPCSLVGARSAGHFLQDALGCGAGEGWGKHLALGLEVLCARCRRPWGRRHFLLGGPSLLPLVVRDVGRREIISVC